MPRTSEAVCIGQRHVWTLLGVVCPTGTCCECGHWELTMALVKYEGAQFRFREGEKAIKPATTKPVDTLDTPAVVEKWKAHYEERL